MRGSSSLLMVMMEWLQCDMAAIMRGAGVLDEKSARRWSSVPFPLPLHCSLQRAQACFAGRRVMSFGSGNAAVARRASAPWESLPQLGPIARLSSGTANKGSKHAALARLPSSAAQRVLWCMYYAEVLCD
ncbi:unnamed protein product [Gadus morhua 'NCC']